MGPRWPSSTRRVDGAPVGRVTLRGKARRTGRERRVTTAEELLSDQNWRLRNSVWIAGTLFYCCFTWASFLYVGISAKRRSWLIAAGGYGAATVAFMALSGSGPRLPDGTADSSRWQSKVGMFLALGVWAGGFVHALAINRSWLRFKAGADSSSRPAAGSNGAASAVPTWGAAGAVGGQGTANQYSSHAPLPPPPTSVLRPPSPARPNAGTAAARERPSSHDDQALIDVNTATLADFLGRAGLDVESAERAIVARQRFGGFWSIDEFMTAARLPPDNDAQVRNLVTVRTLPQKPQPERPDSPNRQGGDNQPNLDV